MKRSFFIFLLVGAAFVVAPKFSFASVIWDHSASTYGAYSVTGRDDFQGAAGIYLGTTNGVSNVTTTLRIYPQFTITSSTWVYNPIYINVCPGGYDPNQGNMWNAGGSTATGCSYGGFGGNMDITAGVPIDLTFPPGYFPDGAAVWLTLTNNGSAHTQGTAYFGVSGNGMIGTGVNGNGYWAREEDNYGVGQSVLETGSAFTTPPPVIQLGQYDYSSGVGGSPVSIVIASGTVSHIDTLTIGMMQEYTWGFFFPFAIGWNCNGGVGYESGASMLIGSGCANVRQLGGYNATTTMGATGTAYVWTGLDQNVSGNVYLSWGGAYGEAGAYGTNSYSGSTFGYCGGSYCTPTIGSSNVPYIIVNGTTPPPPPPPQDVWLEFPANGTTVPDFSNWVIGWDGDIPYGEMHVVYGMSSSSLNYDDHIDFSPFVSINPLAIHKSQSLFYIPLAIPATWYAQVLDVGASETVYSPIVHFSIDPNFANPSNSTDTTLAGPFFGTGGGETSSTIPYPTTNCQYSSSSFLADPIGNIENGICNALVFLFIPNSTEQTALFSKFNDTWNQISNRVPFGYVGIITTAFQNFKDGNTTSTLITSSTYTALSSVLDPLKTGISFLLILLLAFAILHFARNINL